jgi:hypothetical protein
LYLIVCSKANKEDEQLQYSRKKCFSSTSMRCEMGPEKRLETIGTREGKVTV